MDVHFTRSMAKLEKYSPRNARMTFWYLLLLDPSRPVAAVAEVKPAVALVLSASFSCVGAARSSTG